MKRVNLEPNGKNKECTSIKFVCPSPPTGISSQTAIKRLACPQPEPLKHRLKRTALYSIFRTPSDSWNASLEICDHFDSILANIESTYINCQHALGILRRHLYGAFHCDYFPCSRGCFAVFKKHQAITKEEATWTVESTSDWEYISLRLSSSQERHKPCQTVRKSLLYETRKPRSRHS